MYFAGCPRTPTLATTMLQPVLLLLSHLPASTAISACCYCHISLLATATPYCPISQLTNMPEVAPPS